LAEKQPERCSDLLKAALTARPDHLDIRALYVYFLSEVGNLPAAKDFAVTTLKDFNKLDTYALSAMAQLLYSQARESRGQKPEDVKDRTSRYYRACEAFDKVIQLDPHNSFAAQGIAIALAENNLGGKAPMGQASSLASSESAQRARNLRDALTIFTKVRETVNDGNAYVNIGLCHVQRDEWERAIESASWQGICNSRPRLTS
jgi:RNA polymerase-associated protein CTR9